jgi:hypothetical protein
MIRKNKKFIDPRYFMNEKMERILNEEVQDPLGAALYRQLIRNQAQRPEMAVDVGELFDDETGLVWQELAQMGAGEEEIQRMKGQKSEYYHSKSGKSSNVDGDIYEWVRVGMPGNDKIYLDPHYLPGGKGK